MNLLDRIEMPTPAQVQQAVTGLSESLTRDRTAKTHALRVALDAYCVTLPNHAEKDEMTMRHFVNGVLVGLGIGKLRDSETPGRAHEFRRTSIGEDDRWCFICGRSESDTVHAAGPGSAPIQSHIAKTIRQRDALLAALQSIVNDYEATARSSYVPAHLKDDPYQFEPHFEECDPVGFSIWRVAKAAVKEVEEGK